MTNGGVNFGKMTLADVSLHGDTVLVRADYNVPLDDKGAIADDFRLRASLPTLRALQKAGCKIVIISHLGRPDGRDPKLSLEPVAERLAELLGSPVQFIDDSIGDKVKMAVKKAPKNAVLLLENLRFYPGEEKNDPAFAKQLAVSSGAQYFIQDGFGAVHRAHASTDAITQFLPSVAGLLVEREVTTILRALKHPKRPFVAILGGAKVSDKIAVIKELVQKADQILIGGAMANTFLAANGIEIGKSRVERDQFATVDAIYEAARQKVGDEKIDDFIRLPRDVAVAKTPDDERRSVGLKSVAADDLLLDIGDQTIEQYAKIVAGAGTVIWNGTLGMAEKPAFAHGSARMALELATHPDTTSIIGGGDTADFVLNWDSKNGGSFTHVSTGGGASLELMAGEKLPGIQALLDARK